MYNKILISKVKTLNFKFPNSKISKDLEVSKGTVSSYLNGKIQASENFLNKFANKYGFDIEDLKEKSESKNLTKEEIETLSNILLIEEKEKEALELNFVKKWLNEKLLIAKLEVHEMYDRKLNK